MARPAYQLQLIRENKMRKKIYRCRSERLFTTLALWRESPQYFEGAARPIALSTEFVDLDRIPRIQPRALGLTFETPI
jgi:hypothetical protein